MKKLKCLVVDDEPLAREGIEAYIDKVPFLEHVQSFKDALSLQSYLNDETADLIFLDIEMPHLTGMQFLKTQKHIPPVIFTTAYSEYALESYQFDVIDYLLKPISFERFLQSVNKANRLLHGKSTEKDDLDYIFIKTDQGLERIVISDILFVESMQNYIQIHTETKKHLTLVPLKNIFEMLGNDDFTQIHKSYIISNQKVEGIIGNQVVIKENRIPISERLKKEVLESLTKGRFLKK